MNLQTLGRKSATSSVNEPDIASDKHCVFRCGETWFSVPAVSVREIVMTPELVAVPDCHEALVGLCHLRSDFIPVVTLQSLLDSAASIANDNSSCLLVFDHACAWALLISGSAGLEAIETIVSQDSRSDHDHSVVIGTAMFRDRIVRVLNPNALLAKAQQAFEGHWNY